MSKRNANPRPSGSSGGIATGAGLRSRSDQELTAAGVTATEASVRTARRRWVSGVAVVTTTVPEGFRGATVSAFAPVSLEPPLVLICLDRSGRMADAVPAAGQFAVSLLDRGQEAIADRFAGRGPLPDVRLTGIPYALAPSGCPIVIGALAWFDCRVETAHDAGDHRIVVGLVTTVGGGDDTDDPLVSYEGSYRAIESA